MTTALLPDRDLVRDQPMVEWSEHSHGIRVCAVTQVRHRAREQQFVQEMVSRWLIVGRSLPLVSATSEVVDRRHFMTVEVEVERPADWSRVRKNLSQLCAEIRLGLLSPAYARFIRDNSASR